MTRVIARMKRTTPTQVQSEVFLTSQRAAKKVSQRGEMSRGAYSVGTADVADMAGWKLNVGHTYTDPTDVGGYKGHFPTTQQPMTIGDMCRTAIDTMKNTMYQASLPRTETIWGTGGLEVVQRDPMTL